MLVLQSILGLVAFMGLAWLLSENRGRVSMRMAVVGLLLQVVTGLILLKVPFVQEAFLQLNRLVVALEQSTRAGTSFVFGYIGAGRSRTKSPTPPRT